MSVIISAILTLTAIRSVRSQIQQIQAPELSGQENFQPWINPGPPYKDTKEIQSVAQKRSFIEENDSRPKRKIQAEGFKLFLPGLGVVKDYVPAQVSKRPQRQSVTFR